MHRTALVFRTGKVPPWGRSTDSDASKGPTLGGRILSRREPDSVLWKQELALTEAAEIEPIVELVGFQTQRQDSVR